MWMQQYRKGRTLMVLFIALALPGGLVWDSDAWASILEDGARWVERLQHGVTDLHDAYPLLYDP